MDWRSLGIRHKQRFVRTLRGQQQVLEVNILPKLLLWLVMRDPAREVGILARCRREVVETSNGEAEEHKIPPYARREV